MDGVITANVLPRIVQEFSATTATSLSLGTVFLLSQSIIPPLYGMVSECVGRKYSCLAALAIFFVASVLCGSAQNIEWLIAGRAVSRLVTKTICALPMLILRLNRSKGSVQVV